MRFFKLVILFAIILIVAGCARQTALQATWFESYRDIPGITDAQISAIGEARARHDYFLYGMLQNDEAFYTLDGEIVGFSTEMCEWLTGLFGIPFVPVIFDELPELMDALADGTVHFTGQFPRVPMLEEMYFMTDPISKRSTAVARMHGSRPFSEISRERALNFIFSSGSALPDVLVEMGIFSECAFVPLIAETYDEAAEMLRRGEADAYIGDGVLSLSIDFPYFHVEPLYPFFFGYASFAAQNPDLAPFVDAVQLVIDNDGMTILANLYAAGKEDARRHIMSLLLTDEERAFIANNPVIPIAAHGFSYPISFFNNWENEFQGIAFDILTEVEALTGLSFEIANPDSPFFTVAQRMLHDGEALLATGAYRDTGEYGSLLSMGFFTDSYALISYGDKPIISVNEVIYMRVALIGGGTYEEVFRTMFPNHLNVVTFDYKDDVLYAIESGAADLAFSSLRGLFRANHLLERPGFRANIVLDKVYSVSFAISYDAPILLSIIDKALTIIDTSTISDDWMGRTFDFSVRVLMAQRPWLIGTIVLLFCIIVLISIILGTQHSLAVVEREKAKAIEKEREADIFKNALYEASPMFIDVWDEELNLVDCNDKVCDLLGVPNKEEFLNNFFEKYNPKYQPCGTLSVELYRQKFQIGLEKGFVKYEWTHLDVNGNEVPLEVTYICVKHQGKNVLVGYNYDLRPIKQTLAEKQRVEVAVQSNRAKSRFLARMSHEIRTPITSVLGISEIELQNENLPPRLEESLEKIHSSAKILLSIVNDILDLSKIEAGKMELFQEEYDVANMISDITQLHPGYVNNKNIEFRLNVAENIPAHLFGDVLRIEQIINNLLSNAFKYTKDGVVELSLCCEHGENDGAVNLIFTVSDTGIGLTPRQLDILRNSEYTRFHERENRLITGTGLGMPIVFNLLQMMDATIDIESNVGKGTQITVRIPQKTTEHLDFIDKETIAGLQKFDENVRASGKKFAFTLEPMPYGKVLVVDDVEANIYVARGLLQFYDLQIESCHSGQDAIKKIEQNEVYDIIFMDYMMPGLNGIDTMKKMREMGYTAPIVALTANAFIGQAEEFILHGFDGFISKPIQTKQLNALLRKYVRDKQPPEVIEAAALSRTKIVPPEKTGINDFQHSAATLEKLRNNFVRNNKNIFSDISQTIKNGDTKTAHILAHSLKGVAGLIHERALRRLAEQTERILEADELPPPTLLSDLETELNRVLARIKPSGSSFVTEGFDKSRVFEMFDKIAPLLATHNSKALDYLEEFRTIPEAVVLVRLIEEFEFAAALSNMRVLRTILEEK